MVSFNFREFEAPKPIYLFRVANRSARTQENSSVFIFLSRSVLTAYSNLNTQMARMKKKHCTPEILGRIFGDRAQPLLRKIISLLTPPQAVSECCKWCSDNRCLNCSVASGEAEAVSFLLRTEDPLDYRNLLSDCFIVVEEDAPRIDGCCPLNPWEWTQRVVRVSLLPIIFLYFGYSSVRSSDQHSFPTVYFSCRFFIYVTETRTKPKFKFKSKN